MHWVCSISDFDSDKHFKSQANTLYQNGVCLVNRIGHLETIETDWAELAQIYNFSTVLHHANKSNTETVPAKKLLDNYYTDELIELVVQRYHADFELFGYDTTLP